MRRYGKPAAAPLGLDMVRILSHDYIAARRQRSAGSEPIRNASAEVPAGQIDILSRSVMELDELNQLGFHVRIVVNLVNYNAVVRLGA